VGNEDRSDDSEAAATVQGVGNDGDVVDDNYVVPTVIKMTKMIDGDAVSDGIGNGGAPANVAVKASDCRTRNIEMRTTAEMSIFVKRVTGGFNLEVMVMIMMHLKWKIADDDITGMTIEISLADFDDCEYSYDKEELGDGRDAAAAADMLNSQWYKMA